MTRRVILGVCALIVVATWPRGTRANQPATAGPAPSSLSRACARLATIGAENAGADARVESDWPPSSPRGAALEAHLSECLGPASDAVSRTLRMRVEGEFLLIEFRSGRRYSWLRRFLGLTPSPVEVSVRLDAELRTYVAQRPVLRRGAVVARAVSLPSRDYTGIAARRQGVVLMTATDVTSFAYRVRRGRPAFAVQERLRLEPHFSNRRDVLAPAEGGGFYWMRGSSLRHLRLGPLDHFAVASPCEEGSFPFEDACAHWALGRDYFDSRLATRANMVPPERAPTSFYSRVRRQVRRTDGTIDPVEVVVSPRGRIVARTGERDVGVAGYGAALAGADVDHDGSMEIFASLDSPVGEGDRLHIIRVRPNGSLIRIWMSEPIEGSVLHATSGDLDGDGLEEFLAIEEFPHGRARLWIVR